MKTIRNAETDQKADAAGARRLVITLWLGLFAYVAARFLIIPGWNGITRDVWVVITLVIFTGALVYEILTLAAYGPAEDSEPRRNVPILATHRGQALRGRAHA